MGIKGLHGLLKSIQKPCNLKKFDGQTLGVDAYGWLHRGTAACATELALNKPTTRHVDFVLNRVRMLLFFGVTPYLVFDGGDLPSKSGTEADRFKKREDSRKLGLELQSIGRTAEAYQEFQKAVDVTPEMARQLIEELKRMKIQYVVAPYEADAQLVYLEQQGIINGIISEDSDLLVFGARRLLSKLDQHGDCIEINRGDFAACRDISLIGWIDADFRRMCILSGCDYLSNIPKLGLKTAYRSMRKYRDVEKVLRVLQFEGHYQVPAGYLDNFRKAENTFLYQRVFCPTAQRLVTLTVPDPGMNLDEMPYIGADYDPEIAIGVACGDLHPVTKETIKYTHFASRLVPGLMRRQTLASSAELKPKRSIESFFTPRRLPLTELDPNSLTPSPTQQRLLERHANSSWLPSPVNVLGLTRSNSSTSLSRQFSGTPRAVERESFLARAAKVSSTPTATKRPRLCSDAGDDALPTPPEQARSRFFTGSSARPSPSSQKFSLTKKARRSTFGVFSDELAEDIMCQLSSETFESLNSNEKVESEQSSILSTSTEAINTPEGAQTSADECIEEQSCAVVESDTVVEDQDTKSQEDSVGSDKQSVSIDENSELFNQVMEAQVQTQNGSLLSKFVFKGTTSSPSISSPSVLEKPSPLRMAASQSRSPPRPATQTINRSGSLRRRLTPLQRLGQSALARSKSMDTFMTQRMLAKAAGDSGYESDLTRDMPQEAHLKAANHQGSEDQIIPCSDEEEETEESLNDSEPPKTLDLKRFSFVPE
ncbi:exonuclease, putative [Talaromyces stipitatus ATCC 10500]|uniref:Exonuclease, putative n=1 Tax=Talaromyces stipitatus (strain ATCC 10500 / CBS 375.48 / QM 6759 / NRRL 1006) TaxID=441959 RepID=B8MTL4_TALSN|nr:exonuclease, putative [Talaromyces stipitatus ATCC 10500]EED12420.1 exonuclease, putative [Talaromyces stipitatus ATCC 10500]